MDLMPGVTAETTSTYRLTTHWLGYGPPDGVPVLLLHGNLSTGRFFEHVMADLSARAEAAGVTLRLIAPDLRGFGRTEAAAIDATRGMRDWSDDVAALLAALGVRRPVHLVGWSAAGMAISHYAAERSVAGGGTGVASLTYLDPVSPYGYGGVRPDGTPCAPDWAGSGGGGVNPELVKRLRDGDASDSSPFSIRNVMNSLYWRPDFRLPAEREDLLVEEVLLTQVGEDVYPGDASGSPHWPGFGPGVRGILNGLSGRYGSWADIVDLDPKPPVLWTHGSADLVVADGSPLEMGALGEAGAIPGWPGESDYPAQPMISQIRDVLDRYAEAGGRVRREMLEGSGHGPHFDTQDLWCEIVAGFLVEAERTQPV